MKCNQLNCHERIVLFGIGGFFHGPRDLGNHYKFVRAHCPVHGEIAIWPWSWNKINPKRKRQSGN